MSVKETRPKNQKVEKIFNREVTKLFPMVVQLCKVHLGPMLILAIKI